VPPFGNAGVSPALLTFSLCALQKNRNRIGPQSSKSS
jgi:hypothetical protein